MYSIGNPFLTYTIKVTLQQLNFNQVRVSENGTQLPARQVWEDIGVTFVGPQREASHIEETTVRGMSSTPRVL